MAFQTVEVTIDPQGKVTVETKGVVGQGCEALSRATRAAASATDHGTQLRQTSRRRLWTRTTSAAGSARAMPVCLQLKATAIAAAMPR